MNYPEHEKVKAIRAESQCQGEFLEWLGEQGILLCRLDTGDDSGEHYPYIPIYATKEELLARYHGVDLDKLEEEKQAIIEECRSARAIKEFRRASAGRV